MVYVTASVSCVVIYTLKLVINIYPAEQIKQ